MNFVYRVPLLRLLLVLTTLLAVACFPLRDSPYSDQLAADERKSNSTTLANLEKLDPEEDGVVRIGVFGDSHQNYEDLKKVIGQINATKGLDFVVNMGDFTNNSYNSEYDQFLKHWRRLTHLALMVPGNHDLIGSGRSLFQKVFGPSNFIYETVSHRFVFFNNNNLETPQDFDPHWLLRMVEESSRKVVVFSHIPLHDKERFKGTTAKIFRQVIEHPKVEASVNGHNHTFTVHIDSETKMIQAPRVEKARWMIIEFHPEEITVSPKPGGPMWQAAAKKSSY
jgi:predicted phosphodiesterase